MYIIGAIAGDIIGSRHEFRGEFLKTLPSDFPLFGPGCEFTDDSLLTLATMDALLHETPFAEAYRNWGRRYPHLGYGARFKQWLHSDGPAYDSFGNGSAMRVSPIGWTAYTVDQVLEHARITAVPTHDHPEGIKGAQAVALAIFRALRGASKDELRWEIESRFGYDLSRSCDEIRPDYAFDETCQGTVPAAFAAVFDAVDYESAVRNAITLGGDADTLAAIAGSIAEAIWRVPPEIETAALAHLPAELQTVLREFSKYALGEHRGREQMILQSWGLEVQDDG